MVKIKSDNNSLNLRGKLPKSDKAIIADLREQLAARDRHILILISRNQELEAQIPQWRPDGVYFRDHRPNASRGIGTRRLRSEQTDLPPNPLTNPFFRF